MLKTQSSMQKEFYRRFGQILRRARKASGLSQEDLGKAVGLNRTSVSNIEKGRQKILLHTFSEVLRVLKLEAKDLLPPQVGTTVAVEPDLARYRPAERAFIEKGLGLQSREESKRS
jgi:transcriptional regulator with XRE-family HTH domain